MLDCTPLSLIAAAEACSGTTMLIANIVYSDDWELSMS
jgi:hypothetical protein